MGEAGLDSHLQWGWSMWAEEVGKGQQTRSLAVDGGREKVAIGR